MASHFSKFGAGGLGQLGPALRAVGETESAGEAQRPAVPKSPRLSLLVASPPAAGPPPQASSAHTERPRNTSAAGSRGEQAGTRLSRSDPPGPQTCVSYSVACVRFQNILPRPTPERAQTPSVKGTRWGATRASWVTPHPRVRPQEGEAGRFTPLILALATAQREGRAEKVLLAKLRGGARGIYSFKQGTSGSPPEVQAPFQLPQWGPTSKLGTQH